MRWPWRTPHPDPPITAEEARRARRESEAALEGVRAQSGQVTRTARWLRRQRIDNHFAALITRALGEGR